MIVDFSAGLAAGAEVTAGPSSRLARSIVFPHLERLALDCGNCGFLAFRIVVSPLKGETGAAAIVQEIRCARCATRFLLHDGILAGHQKQPIARPVTVPSDR
jgi:hypothetical protein